MTNEDEILDVVQAYQALETSTGAKKLLWLECKIEALGELMSRGFGQDQARAAIKALPGVLSVREVLSGTAIRLNAVEAVTDLLNSGPGRQALGLKQYEDEAAFLASLAKMKPAERISAARAKGVHQ